METITRYRAFDGAIFDDPEDCKTYERAKKLGVNPGFRLYSKNGNLLSPMEMSSYESADIVVIETPEGGELCRDMFNEAGLFYIPGEYMSLEDTVGLWTWDEDEDDWYQPEARAEFYKQMAEQTRQKIRG